MCVFVCRARARVCVSVYVSVCACVWEEMFHQHQRVGGRQLMTLARPCARKYVFVCVCMCVFVCVFV